MINYDPWSICRMTDCGHLVVLAGFDTYAKADEVSDDYAEQYPDGLVDIYSRGFLLNCEVDQ